MTIRRRRDGMRFAAALAAATLAPAVQSSPAGPITEVAFGSCARQGQPQPIWDAVLAAEPDVFVLAGDNVYADTREREAFDAAYARLAAKPGFDRLRRTTRLLATWDDHDYGVNDGDASFPARATSQRAFLEFFDVPADDPRRERPGIYRAYRFGPADRRVQIVLLDTRYFRSEVGRRDGRYEPRTDAEATMLGEAQWQWLEEVLQRPAALRLLVSSTQVLPTPRRSESWSTMPRERERLLELVGDAGRTILLSGDRHFGEILRAPASTLAGVDYPLYEVTASGLNVAGEHWEADNAYRFGEGPFPGDHFGLVSIDWAQGRVSLEIRDVDGEVVRHHGLALDALANAGDG